MSPTNDPVAKLAATFDKPPAPAAPAAARTITGNDPLSKLARFFEQRGPIQAPPPPTTAHPVPRTVHERLASHFEKRRADVRAPAPTQSAPPSTPPRTPQEKLAACFEKRAEVRTESAPPSTPPRTAEERLAASFEKRANATAAPLTTSAEPADDDVDETGGSSATDGDDTDGDDTDQDAHEFAIDPQVRETYDAAIQELGIASEDGQAILDMVVPVMQQRQQAALAKLSDDWAAASRSDPEFGGEHFAKNIDVAKGVLQRFATPKLRRLLDDTGLGNNPELIRVFTRIGKALAAKR